MSQCSILACCCCTLGVDIMNMGIVKFLAKMYLLKELDGVECSKIGKQIFTVKS
jgi:hypothetical protein